jgi:tRNA-specific 2-thiouridylase
LPVALKKDSQGICFIGDVKMDEFLAHFMKIKSGLVLNTSGAVIGTHQGVVLYAIGERHGFEITKKEPRDGAFYIVSKDLTANTLTVSHQEPEILSLSPIEIIVKNVNWMRNVTFPHCCLARIRYRGDKVSVTIHSSTLETIMVRFNTPMRGLSLGQSIVFYLPAQAGDNDICLGGGVMDQIL